MKKQFLVTLECINNDDYLESDLIKALSNQVTSKAYTIKNVSVKEVKVRGIVVEKI